MEGSSVIIVRTRGGWVATWPERPGHIEVWQLDQVLNEIGPASAPAAEPLRSAPLDATAGDGEAVSAVWGFAAGRAAGGLAVEGPDGRLETLDHQDVRLLDLLAEQPRPLCDVASESTDRARIRRLVKLGCARLVADCGTGSAEEPRAEPTQAPEGPDEVDSLAADDVTLPEPRPSSLTMDGRLTLKLADRVRTAWTLSSKLASVRAALGDRWTNSPPGQPSDLPLQTPLAESSTAHQSAASSNQRIPVFAPWHPETGIQLSLGMLTSAARAWLDADVTAKLEIHRPERADHVLAQLEERDGPAIVLLSQYVWTEAANWEFLAAARRRCAELFVVHGGPSAPRFDEDARAYLRRDPESVLVLGEGEATLVELLEVVAGQLPHIDRSAFRGIDGLLFLDGDELVRTRVRDRIADLDTIPSPFLSGEFDDLPSSAWPPLVPFETNRGCPYGCTFCDWGSATMSRIRKFSLDRLRAEIDWLAGLAKPIWIADANFGILPRDVEIVQAISAIKLRTGHPEVVAITPAKNSSRYLLPLIDEFTSAGISLEIALALQTTDSEALEAVGRNNIPLDRFVTLAAEFRRRGLPVVGELMFALPGQSYEAFRGDVQFMFDHEIRHRTWATINTPNAPMNDPAYRKRWSLEINASGEVAASSTMSRDEREKMVRLRAIDVIVERVGLLRHVARYLQWDHGIDATRFMERLLEAAVHEAARYPLVAWVIEHYTRFSTIPVGRRAFLAEVRALIEASYPEAAGVALDVVFAVQEFLLPANGRTFPDVIRLDHDYAAYYWSASASLFTSGTPSPPSQPLQAWSPGYLRVAADPLDLCGDGPFQEWSASGFDPNDSSYGHLRYEGSAPLTAELVSPLMRLTVPGVEAVDGHVGLSIVEEAE